MTTFMNRARLGGLSVLASVMLLSACGGGGDGGDKAQPVTATTDVTDQVPVAASVDANAATAYVSALSATSPAVTDTKDPVDASAPLATSDNQETS